MKEEEEEEEAEGEEEEDGNGDEDDDDDVSADLDLDSAEIKGWPLGLWPESPKLAEAGATSIMTLPSSSSSGSSSSSSSSSDSDAESIGSFFPEDSTSLGTLIGIHSSSQLLLRQDLAFKERLAVKRRFVHRRFCSLLGCGAKVQEDLTEENDFEDSTEASPSLSRHCSMARREIMQTASNSDRIGVAGPKKQMEVAVDGHDENRNLHLHKKSWVHSRSCRPLLNLSQKPYTVPSWRGLFSASLCSSMRSNEGIRSSSMSARTHIHSFWLALHSKLRST